MKAKNVAKKHCILLFARKLWK